MARRPDSYLETHPHSRWQRFKRWSAKGRSPNASTGRWDKDDRSVVVSYLWWRDGRSCGLCAQPMPLEGAVIEHVVPKKFGFFDLKNKRGQRHAVPGEKWQSRLHHLDNLQAAHSYCNRAKGNAADISKWRHPKQRPLPVAVDATGASSRYLWLPREPPPAES